MIRTYARIAAAVAALALTLGPMLPALAADVKVTFIELGYRDGVTVAGVAPSVTFDLPRYSSLQAARAHLELHVSQDADLTSTISVAVNGTTAYTKALAEIGRDALLDIPLPVPPANAQLFAVTVSGALRVTGDPCANNSSQRLFLRLGRDSSLVLRTASGGTAEAFFRDYRAAMTVTGALDDPQIVALPYQIDRLEPWHRITATLVPAPPRSGRAIELVPNVATSRAGDVLRVAPAAFAALPVPQGQTPMRANGSVAFGDLHQHLGTASGTGDLAFDIPLKGSVTGGVPQQLAVHADVQHSALPAGATGTVQVFVNGLLTGARELGRDAGTQTVNVDVPQSTVGPSNSVRILVSTDIPPGACLGAASAITASLLDSSTFTWSGIVRKPPSIESYLTALNGRVAVLVAPEFTRTAFHMMGSIGRLNAAITQLDVKPYDGKVPDGYDFAIVFAPPSQLDGLHLPVRPSAPAFTMVNPTDDRHVFTAGADSAFALLQLGDANGTPVLAVSYHGAASALAALENVRAAQLATQVSVVSIVSGTNVTTYDVGEKLRMSYPGELTAAEVWSRIKLPVALVLLVLIVLGGRYAARRLTGENHLMLEIDDLSAQLIAAADVSPESVDAARAIQAQSGGELGWILASMGVVSRRALYETLADYHGLPLVRDVERMRTNVDIDLIQKMTYEDVIRQEFMPFSLADGLLVIATSHPQSAAAHAFARERFGCTAIAELLISDLDLTLIASHTYRDTMIDHAVMSNFHRNPEQSARRVFTVPQIFTCGIILALFVVWMYIDVRSMLIAIIAVLQVFFLASVAFKVVLSIAGAQNEISQPISHDEIVALRDEDLPVYTVLVPVYKEPEVVHQLIDGLKNIDYPQHKLDVMLLLEEDDVKTLQAAKDARPPANWRFIVVPNRQPRTKPKACNYGLAFAHGEYLVIYDAEDIPEPAQLKMAVVAFRKNPSDYVCFQAALNYFNATENVLTRMFTLEYSYWFDYLIPGLDRLKLPIPLGGTSNHFDVSKLRKLGGWDPFNTTEDADLGIRASAEKYRVGFINSTTFEEANADLGNWIRQRSRWVKGYMQTFLVYWRHPGELIRTIGLKNFLAFNLFVGGTPLTFLASPPLWALFVYWLLTRSHAVEPLFPDAVLYLALANLLIGNFLGIYLNMIAIYLRKNYALMPFALLNPIYWLFHSIAAYKALGQLFTKPFYWEKTLHGISRVAPKTMSAQRSSQ